MDHIIHKQFLDLHLEKEMENPYQVQSDFVELIEKDLLPKLEKLFDQFAGKDEWIIMDKLEIDAGIIASPKLAKEFVNSVLIEVKKKLEEATSNTGLEVKEKPVKRSMEEMIGQSLLFFLKHGNLPWWTPERPLNMLVRASEEYQVTAWNQFSSIILEELKNPNSHNRFLNEFPENIIDQWLLALSGNASRDAISVLFKSGPSLIEKSLKSIYPLNEKEISVILREAVLSGILSADEKSIWPKLIKSINEKAKVKPGKLILQIIRTLEKEYEVSNIVSFDSWIQDLLILHKDFSERTKISDKLANENGESDPSFDSSKTKLAKTDSDGIQKSEKELQNQKEKIKSQKKHPEDFKDGILVNNAGLVLLWPYLGYFFKALNFLDDQKFVDQDAQQKAVIMLNYVASGEIKASEDQLALPKLICGWGIEEPIETAWEFTKIELKETDNLLKAVIRNWGALKSTTPEGLREGFLLREGVLRPKAPKDWHLRVEQKGQDVLLGKLSWGIGLVKLDWLDYFIHVDWA